MFGPVITTEAHLAYACARHHSNNTAKISSIVGDLSSLGPRGPVARDSQACIFYDSRHAVVTCLGTVQSRANVSLGLTCQCLLLQIPVGGYDLLCNTSTVMPRIPTLLLPAALLGTFGLVSNQIISTRWTHSSFDTTSLIAPCDNLDDVLQVLRNVRTTRLPAPQRLARIW